MASWMDFYRLCTNPRIILFLLWVSRVFCTINISFTTGGEFGVAVWARTLFILAIVFSIIDLMPLAIYESIGKTRSIRGTIIMMTSLALTSLCLVFTALFYHPLKNACNGLRATDCGRNSIMQTYFAFLGLNGLAVCITCARYIWLFCIPGPGRLPRDYKPFGQASSSSDMQELEPGNSDGSLAAIFLEQEMLQQQTQQSRRQGELSTQERNKPGPSHQVCSVIPPWTISVLTYLPSSKQATSISRMLTPGIFDSSSQLQYALVYAKYFRDPK